MFTGENLRQPDVLLTPEERPFKGGTVVTFGGSRGIGAAVNSLFAELGADIVTIHKDPTKEKRQAAVLEKIKEAGSQVRSIIGDITEIETQQRVLEAAQGLGNIFVLNINAAGGAVGKKEEARKLNVAMPPQVVKTFLPYMIEGGVSGSLS